MEGMKTISLMAAVALTSLGLAACGSAKKSASSVDPDAARIKFGECMRAHGIDFSEGPAPGGGQATRVRVGKGGSPQKVQAATKECAKQTGGGPKEPSASEQAEFKDKAVKFAACMRSHGIDMPDPTGSGGIMIQKGPQGLNPNSPRFKTAQADCQKLLPGGGKGMVNSSSGGPSGPSVQTGP